jgi:membrane protein DedA with SNARE-associated domain
VSSELTHYIAEYGYLAIFLFVFLQELGVPNPVTNEFVLLYSGYLAFTGVLNLWFVLLAAISADCIGTTILYAVFYSFGGFLMDHRPRWFPASTEDIKRMEDSLSGQGRWGIYVGRLIPFLRGYVSVAAGMLAIRPGVFLPAVIISAITWSGGYVVAGRLVGPYWKEVAGKMGTVEQFVLLAALIVIAALVRRTIVRRRRHSEL